MPNLDKSFKIQICPLCHSDKIFHYFTDTKNTEHTYFQCNQCDLVFVIPECRLSKEEEKIRYDMHDNDENDHRYKDFLNRLAGPVINALNTNKVTNKDDYNGLDFGSGRTELMADIFHQNNYKCSSYDIFYFPDKQLLQNQYDFITASEVVEHLYNPLDVITQLWDCLKDNGLLGIMTNRCVTQSEFPNWWYKNDPTHVSLFSNQTFEYIAKKLSAKIILNDKTVIILQK